MIILSIRWIFSSTPVVRAVRNSVADFEKSWDFFVWDSTWSKLWLTESISHRVWNAAIRVLRLELGAPRIGVRDMLFRAIVCLGS